MTDEPCDMCGSIEGVEVVTSDERPERQGLACEQCRELWGLVKKWRTANYESVEHYGLITAAEELEAVLNG